MINAVTCALRGIDAVHPRALVVAALTDRAIANTVHVISLGKAATTMALGAIDVLGERIVQGIVIAPTPTEGLPSTFTVYQGGHPIPNAQGAQGAQAILEFAEKLSADDEVLCLISGGASALTMLPPEDVPLEDVRLLTMLLLHAGATIGELNCVRKHIDRLKGGRLARAAAPARVVTLILSDVIGDPIDVIASGPTVPDPTTFADAKKVLQQRGVWNALPPSVRQHFDRGVDESPKPFDACFKRASSEVIGSNIKAAQSACDCAELLGYNSSVMTTALQGEAREVGAKIAKHALSLQQKLLSDQKTSSSAVSKSRAQCLIYAGETTVTVTGNGRGGRNQELVLAAALALEDRPGITITSIGTDGIDGPTDAAGAVTDGTTLQRAKAKHLDAQQALRNNDAYTFWSAIDGLVMTGPTGTNVMDLIVVTIE